MSARRSVRKSTSLEEDDKPFVAANPSLEVLSGAFASQMRILPPQEVSAEKQSGISYTTGAGSYVFIPPQVNPFQILGVDPKDDRAAGKKSFQELIRTPNREQRALVSLAYAMYCRIKYREAGDTTSLERAHFVYDETTLQVTYDNGYLWTLVLAGHVQAIKSFVERDKSLLTKDNDSQETMLYIAARSGFVDVVSMLLNHGSPVNHQQKTGSTALHAAAYFGHLPVVTRLLAAGADANIRNRMPDNRPIDEIPKSAIDVAEALTNAMKSIDPLTEFIQQAQQQRLATTVQNIEFNNEIVAVRVDHQQRPGIPSDWLHAWHGTKRENLLSIFAAGLRRPGTKLPTGESVKIPSGHIPSGVTVDGVKNWSSAVFVSPSLTYSAHPAYAKRFTRKVGDGEWCCIIHVLVRPNSFTSHPSTVVVEHKKLLGEPQHPELRVSDEPFAPVSEFDAAVRHDGAKKQATREEERPCDALLRVPNETNVFVAGVLFARTDFLENAPLTYEEMQALFVA